MNRSQAFLALLLNLHPIRKGEYYSEIAFTMSAPQHPPLLKPLKRSNLRRRLGRQYHIVKRWLKMAISGTRFARKQSQDFLPHTVFSHQSILLRKLKDVDMWMQHNKITNLRLAISNLDGLLIQPGETFSYWKCIGNPSKRKGYLPGMQLDQGKFKSSTGGGLCQLSNLIFWMTLHTPLTVVERWRHSFDVFPDAGRTLPFGSGATCAYNYIDLQLRNDTDRPIQLKLWLSDTHLHGEWRSEMPLPHKYEVYESDHLFRQEYWGYSRHNRLARRVFDAKTGELLREEPLIENHAVMMYNPLLAENNSASPSA